MCSLSEGVKRDACCPHLVHVAGHRGLGNAGIVRWRRLWEEPVRGGGGTCLALACVMREKHILVLKPLPPEGLFLTAASPVLF